MRVKSIHQRLCAAQGLQERPDGWELVMCRVSERGNEAIISDAVHLNCPITNIYYLAFPYLSPLRWIKDEAFCLHCGVQLPIQYAAAINIAKHAVSN